jgi:hypothetical protein
MTLRNVRSLPAVAALTSLVVVLSCYPGEVQSLQELDLSIAIRNPRVPESEFGTILTYAMPDTVVQVTDTSDADPPELSHAYDDYILSLVESHLEGRGYERVAADTANPPDVLVLVAATARTFSGAVWYPGWWYGWYWPPYYPCYYCGYPGGYWETYEWDQGSIIITMTDPAAPTDSTVRVLWMGVVTGVLSNPGTGTQSRIETGINRVFELSPYLRRN